MIKKIGSKSHKPMAEINVVPYIDVMLVLLIIFMVTAPMLTQGVDVSLPKAAAKTLAQNAKEPIIVSVDSYGNYYLNIAANPTRPIDKYSLQNTVARELQIDARSGSKRQVLVKGDERVNYGSVVAAMVVLKAAGAQSVGLITEPIKQK